MYVSHLQLAERPGPLELSQVASDAHDALVDAELMDATLRATDRSAWSAGQQAAADEALARIDDAVTNADGLIEGFLSQAAYTLPLSPVPTIVTGWSRDIARYFLHKDRIQDERSDPIARAYRDALALLRLTADGKFSLGINDPQAPTQDAGLPQFEAPDRVYSADTLRDFQ